MSRRRSLRSTGTVKLAEFAPPGEQMQLACQAITGPSPWVDDPPYVRFAMLFVRGYYFVVLTNTSVVIVEADKWTGRPANLVCAEHFSTAMFSEMKINPLWSKVYYRMPHTGAPERLNVHRRWREELDALVSRLPQLANLAA